MWNKHIAGKFQLGNDIEALRTGGTFIELGNNANKKSSSVSSGSKENVIQVDENKINLYYDVIIKHSHWYDFLPFVGPSYTHKEEKYTILEKELSNIKNLNITDYRDNKKENILYYTVDGNAMAFNLKTKKETELFGIEDNNQMLNIEVMFLVDNAYLYILSDSRTYVYDIKEETTKKLDICTSVKANFFIPTDLGSIFFSDKAIIVKDTNFMDYVYEAKYNSDCSNFRFCNIDEENLVFALSLAETESELAKDVKYSINLKNLFDYSFGSISEDAIGRE